MNARLIMVVVMSSMACVSTLPVAIYVRVNRDSSLKRTANSSAKVRGQIKRQSGYGKLDQYIRPRFTLLGIVLET